jgi:hypothetical protein
VKTAIYAGWRQKPQMTSSNARPRKIKIERMKIKKKKYESGELKNIENGKGIFGRDSICISWGFFFPLSLLGDDGEMDV